MTATARFAGSVHGVVVHTATPSVLPSADATAARGSGRSSVTSTGKAAYTEREVWPSGYSSSASASAVRELGDQLTGLRPR